MNDFSLRQYIKDSGAHLNPGLRSLSISSLGCLKWFETGGNPSMQPIRSGNLVTPLIDGPDTFKSMYEALLTANSSDHYIYLLGWWLNDDLKLLENDPNSTIQEIFKNASQKGVQIRAMLWYQHFTDLWQNSKEVDRINKLETGAAILDSRHLYFGSHHQKILIVKGTKGLIAFCGGVDINPDRVCSPCSWLVSDGGDGIPFHDVHCRIQGFAAYDLLRIFVERWQDHPDHDFLDKKAPLLGTSEIPDKKWSIGSLNVQIGRTYGNLKKDPVYHFAPNGEQTARRMILRAISEARQYIYMEDQYLVNMEASQALVKALPNIQHLTILIPDGSITSMPQTNYRRQQFIAPLKKSGGDKVRVFKLSPPGSLHTYVHSKVYIIDDRFAIIGSVNCNRRSWTHDSEVMAGIYDPICGEFARNLRIALWAEHLCITKEDSRLIDGVKSADLWLRPPGRFKRIEPYDENADIESIHTDINWNIIVDPDGS